MSIYKSSIPDPQLRRKFPYIVAWGNIMQLNSYMINNTLWSAEEENAPHNSLFRSNEGKWYVYDEVTAPTTRKLLEMELTRLQQAGEF